MNKMNKEELLIGALYGLISCLAIGIMGLIISGICSFLWALTGSESRYNWKIWRRLVCPMLVTSSFFFTTGLWHNWITVPIHFGTLSLGYGIPDETDKGSFLGRFFMNFLNDHELADFATRASIYLLIGIGAIPLLVR